MKTSIVFIGTGKYINFLPEYYNSIKEHFAPETERVFHVFTDNVNYANWPNDINLYQIQHMQWPFVTLLRYKYMSLAMDQISKSDACAFVDADLMWKKQVTIEGLLDGKGHFGVQHPGFVFEPHKATFERDTRSKAFVSSEEDCSNYWQGCLWGARSDKFVTMVESLTKNVDDDLNSNVVAIWHDESHLNRYFITNKSDVNTLHPGFATPEMWDHIKQQFPTVALHLHKTMEEFPRFEGIR